MTTTKPQSTTEETWRSDKAHEAICEAAESIANQYRSEDDTYSLEVRRLTVAISDVVDRRISPASAAPVVDNAVAFNAYNQAIEDAKAAIRGETVDDPYAAPTFINAIARKCSPHVYVNRLATATAAPVEQNVLDSLFAVTLTCNQCGYIQAGSFKCPECDGYLIHLGGR